MRKLGKLILPAMAVVCLAGCGEGPEGTAQPKSVADVVTILTAHALTNAL